MKDTLVIVKNGPHLNATLSSICYGRLGQHTHQPVAVVDNWAEGLKQAKAQGYRTGLFVDSGTIFTDWNDWSELMNKYPHKGLVGHLMWHPGDSLHLHDQCFMLEVNEFEESDFTIGRISHLEPIRSEQNMHDDYTPLWVKPGKENVEYICNKFGQGLLARQLNRGLPAVNWSNPCRQLKWHMYPNKTYERYDSDHTEYNNMAETQLWVLNNEPIKLITGTKLLTPGSGLFWILNATQPQVKEIQVVDISRTQVDFDLDLWLNWDGVNYGEFAWNYIKRHNLIHFEIDQANLEPIERLKLKNSRNFISYINNKFDSLVAATGITDFPTLWRQAKTNTTITFTEANLVTWALSNNTADVDAIWCSNILDYKWTLLHSTESEFEQFKRIINGIPERV